MSDVIYLIPYDTEEGTVGIEPRCHCGRFIRRGQVFSNMFGVVFTKDWLCKKHGEVHPHYEYIDVFIKVDMRA